MGRYSTTMNLVRWAICHVPTASDLGMNDSHHIRSFFVTEVFSAGNLFLPTVAFYLKLGPEAVAAGVTSATLISDE